MSTESEDIVTKISTNVFYKEFTFHKNDFLSPDGQKELADTVLWIDDLLFVIQIKERNIKDIKSTVEENRWFTNTVLKKAKDQIKDSIDFFSKYDTINIRNVRNQTLNIAKADSSKINKIIIYKNSSSLISEGNKALKFCASGTVGNIHLFEIEEYMRICRLLITPAELNDYLQFREELFVKHKEVITTSPEQYILGHFFETDNTDRIVPEYLHSYTKFQTDTEKFDMSQMLNDFADKILHKNAGDHVEYYLLIKEIAKLNRNELALFKERYSKMINDVKRNTFSPPYRFVLSRTLCGFVFVPLQADSAKHWENALLNSIDVYKYKRELRKCVGVAAYKNGEFFDLHWGFAEQDWEYDEELENALKQEEGFYGQGKVAQAMRYKSPD